MLHHMKTTVEIVEPLFSAAKQLAAAEGTTLRALVEEGLRRVLEDRKAARPFKLRDMSVAGNGLQPGICLEDRDQMLSYIYEGRGG